MGRPDQPPQRKDRDERSGYGVAVVVGLFVAFALIVLPFVPLLMALCEGLLFHTHHVEEFCTRIGIHDELDWLYQPITGWFR